MYLDHYQLKLMPFEIRPDPQFLWLGEKHEEAFAILKYGILENKGFTVLIGEPGTGKSTLLNAIVGSFGPKIRFAKIADPALNAMDFFNFVGNAFDMGRTFDSKADFLIHLQQFIGETAARSEKVVLVIDEAQRLTPELLEQIRILSNFERPDQKVISCIFAGQHEFLDMVKHNPAMGQRVFFSHIIQPLTESETGDYIAHRLKVAGAAGKIFSSGSGHEIFLLSGGNPRLINIICDQALLSGYTCDLKTIRPDIIRKCSKNTLIPFEAVPEPEAAPSNGMSQASVEPKENAADATAHLDRRVLPPTLDAFNFKASYWALAAVIVLMGVAYGYYSGAFDTLLSGTQAFSNSDVISRNNFEAGIHPQAVEKAETDPSASDTAQLQGQLLELRKQKSDAESLLKAFQRKIEVFETDQKKLNIASSRIADLEKALTKEKSEKEHMNAELSSRMSAIADLEKRVGAATSVQLKLETDFQNAQRDKDRRQSKRQESIAEKPALLSVPFDTASSEPDPARVIDFIIKKKSQ